MGLSASRLIEETATQHMKFHSVPYLPTEHAFLNFIASLQ